CGTRDCLIWKQAEFLCTTNNDIGRLFFCLHLMIGIRHELWRRNPLWLFARICSCVFVSGLTSICGINKRFIFVCFTVLDLAPDLANRTVFYFAMNGLRGTSE